MSISLSQPVFSDNNISQTSNYGRVMPRVISINESSLRYNDYNPELQHEQKARVKVVKQSKIDLINIVLNDSFEAGVISQSENYIDRYANKENIEYIREAANELYLENFSDPHILTGLLIMMGSLSYNDAYPQGQTMALGLLQHECITVRDRAIQVFERWNSKKGINVLKSLRCDRVWLQKYVDKVIQYLERDGED